MQKSAKYVIGIVAAILGLLIVWYFRGIVFYVIIAAVLAIIGRPLVNLIKKVKIRGSHAPSWLAGLIALICIWGVAVAFFSLFIPLVFNKLSALASVDLQSVLSSFQAPIARFEEFLHEMFSMDTSDFSISNAIAAQLSTIVNPSSLNNLLGSIVSTVGNTLIGIFSVTFITFFFLKDENLFLRILLAITPTKYEGNIKHALNTSTHLLSRYFLGILAESTAMMMMVAISLTCCGYGISNAVFIGLIVGVLNVIPYVGPWLGFGISLLISAAFVSTGMSITFIFFSLGITVLAAQMIDNFVLQPLLYSNSVNAHPLEIFIVILMAGSFAGVIGMLLAIPAYTVLRVVAKEFFNNFKLVRKLTENM